MTSRIGLTGCLDGSILAILLLAISQGSWNTRAGAMMAIICQYANRDGREKASVYIAAIKVLWSSRTNLPNNEKEISYLG